VFTRFWIDNYRCFVNFEFKPERMNLLLGGNGSGKSTFLKLISDVVDVVVRGTDVWPVFPKDTRTRWDKRDQQSVEFDLRSDVGLFHYTLAVADERIGKERVLLDDKVLFEYSDGNVTLHKNDGRPGTSFAFRGARSFLPEIDRRPETQDLMVFLDTLSKIVPLRVDPRKAALHLSEHEQRRLQVDGSNFSSWYRHLTQESAEIINPLWESLTKVIPGFQLMKLVSTEGTERELVATLATGGATYNVAYHELSDGQRCLIILYTLLHAAPQHGLLLLDEPEVHIAMHEVQPWLVELDEKLGRTGQVFLASNLPTVVDYMAASTPWVFDRSDCGPVRIKPADFSTDSGLTPAEQIQQGYAV